MAELETRIHAAAGRRFNIASTRELAQVLFTELELPVLKRLKTGPSTDQDVLEKLAEQHELPRLVLEHRTLSKLKGTYVDALPQLIDPRRRADPHDVQPRRGRDRPALVERPEPAEHPHPDGPVPPDPGGVRRAAGAEAALRRLLADRAADPRALLGRPGAPRRVPPARGRAHAHRRGDLRRGARRGDPGHAPGREDAQLRHRLRPLGVRAVAAARPAGRRGAGDHHAVLRALRGREALRGVGGGGGAQDRRVAHAVRPRPGDAGHRGAQPRAPERRRADRDQHADPGHRRRHRQARDDQGPRRARPGGGATRSCSSRSTTSSSWRSPTPTSRPSRRSSGARWRERPR